MDGNKKGQRIMLLREVSQQKAADEMGIKRETLRNWELGKREPKTKDIIKLSNYYGVSSDYLLGLSDIKSTEKNIQTACEVTGLAESAIESLRSSELRLIPSGVETINTILENREFINIVESLSTYLWGHSYRVKTDVPAEHTYSGMTGAEWERFGSMIQDAMLQRITNSLVKIREEVSNNGKA